MATTLPDATAAPATAAATSINAAKIMDLWETNWSVTLYKFIGLTVVLLAIMIALFQVGNLQEIAKNFPRYRCNPMIMPFASNFGYDTQENFNFCLNNIFNVKAIEVFAPIYQLLGVFTTIVTQLVNVVLGIRKLFSNFLFGVNQFVRNVRDRIQQLLTTVRMSLIRINNLMGRVYGSMYSVIWMGVSALAAGNNVANNDLVKFMFEFCFDPETPVQLADGSYTTIQLLKISDKLASVDGNPSPVVTSTFIFDGSKTPMVSIHGVYMSAEHYVQYMDSWMPAKAHPDARPALSSSRLICLNVTGHMFGVGKKQVIVADYDEHSNSSVVAATQNLALRTLNGGVLPKHPVVKDYSLGMDKLFLIRMADDSYKLVGSVKIGDDLHGCGKILGVVHELCDSVVGVDGLYVAAAQPLMDTECGAWVRGKYHSKFSSEPGRSLELISFITEHCSTITLHTGTKELFTRDYREVPLKEMEDAYVTQFAS
jgi:hypothetical protein